MTTSAKGCRGQVVVIAGATGRLGNALARAVLANGGKVAAAVRKPWQVAKLREQLGAEGVLVGLVPSLDTEAAAGFAKGANDALGPVTAFVGAAGTFAPRTPGREPGSDLADQLEANLLANATLARALLPGLRKRRRGRLVFVGAGAACLAAGAATFVAAKEAVHGFVRALAADLARDPAVRGVEATMLQPDFAARMGDAEIASTAAALLAALGPAAPGVLSPAGS